MASVFSTVNPDMSVEFLGEDPARPGIYEYGLTLKGGPQTSIKNDLNPTLMEKAVGDPDDANHGKVIHHLGFQTLSQGPDKGVIPETIIPAMSKGAYTWPSALAVDLPNTLVRLGLETPFNFLRHAYGGFEGKMPDDRYITGGPGGVGTADWTAKKLEKGALAVSDALKEATGFEWIPDAFWLNLSPKENTRARKALSMISQMAGAAPAEAGALLGFLKN